MTDKEKLAKVRAEIERRYKYNKEHENDWAGTSHFWQRKEDKEILSFIDSMQEEPTTSVWHDSNTVPVAPDKNHLWVVVSFKNGDIRTCFIDTLVTWQRVQREAIDCWAYRDDLLKL